MKEHKPRAPLLVQCLVSLAILVPLVCILWPVVGDARGPRGDAIPSQPPDERNRAHHPLGFSIVVPPDWDHRIGDKDGPLILTPKTPGPHAPRSRALIVVTPLGDHRPPSLGHLHPTSFQGRDAYDGMQVARRWTFDDRARSEYTLVVNHDGHWYEIDYTMAEERTELPGEVRRYLDTLRWKGAK